MENTTAAHIELSPNALNLFRLYWQDAGNWSGTPMLNGNVSLLGAKEDRGLITHLKMAGLIKTFASDGCSFLSFTPAGVAFGASIGLEGWWTTL